MLHPLVPLAAVNVTRFVSKVLPLAVRAVFFELAYVDAAICETLESHSMTHVVDPFSFVDSYVLKSTKLLLLNRR
jgi:hypothetical protein